VELFDDGLERVVIERAGIEPVVIESVVIECVALERVVIGRAVIDRVCAAGAVVGSAGARCAVAVRCARDPARGVSNADHRASEEEEVGLEE
jgi:hypothetical protein